MSLFVHVSRETPAVTPCHTAPLQGVCLACHNRSNESRFCHLPLARAPRDWPRQRGRARTPTTARPWQARRGRAAQQGVWKGTGGQGHGRVGERSLSSAAKCLSIARTCVRLCARGARAWARADVRTCRPRSTPQPYYYYYY